METFIISIMEFFEVDMVSRIATVLFLSYLLLSQVMLLV